MPRKQSDLPKKCQNIVQKTSFSVRVGGPTAATWAINHLIFIKRSRVRFLGLAKGFEDHKVPPWPQMWLRLTKNIKNSFKMSPPALFWWGTQQLLHGSSTTLFSINYLCQVFTDQEVAYRPQSASPTTKVVQLGQKEVTIAKQLLFLLWCEIQ